MTARRLGAWLGMTWLLAAGTAAAQNAPDILTPAASQNPQNAVMDPVWSPVTSVYSRQRPPFEAKGYEVGQFLIFPSTTVTQFYDSNIFATSSNRTSDFITAVQPSLAAETRRGPWTIDGLLSGRVSLFASHSSQDALEYDARLRSKYQLSTSDMLTASFENRRDAVSRQNVEEGGGTGAPHMVERVIGNAGYSGSRGPVVFSLDGKANYNNYEPGQLRDKDRTVYDATGRLGYRVTPELLPFIEPYVEYWDYATAVDSNGYERNATRIGSRVGFEYTVTDTISIRADAGAGRWSFKDPGFGDRFVWSAEALAGWNITPVTTLKLGLSRDELHTTLAASSLKEVRSVHAGIEQSLEQNLLMFVDAAYRNVKFNDIGRTDNDTSLAVGAKYMINRMYAITAGYTYSQRNSNASADFKDNVVWLSLRIQF